MEISGRIALEILGGYSARDIRCNEAGDYQLCNTNRVT